MVKNRQTIIPCRGEIYLVSFDPAIGAEIKKIRPALILQNDTDNKYSPTTIVAAITSKFNKVFYPADVFVRKNEGGLSQDSIVLLNQIRSIDKIRLIKKLGKIKPNTMQKINEAIMISLGLIKI